MDAHRSIHGDPRLRSVGWKDLLTLSRSQITKEITISLPWLLLSWLFAHHHLLLPALLCSFMFFLTGLRQVHNAYHNALGISKGKTGMVMYGLSVLMLASMHAVRYNHLQHHKHCLDDDDLEGMSARMGMARAFLFGPIFPIRLHAHAWSNAGWRVRKWMIVETISMLLFIYLAFAVFDLYFLKYHLAVMVLGESMTAFFAVWTVHHGCDGSERIARTIRGRFKTLVSYSMFYHLEHHLFPAVPTCNLPLLAERLDGIIPELRKPRVF